MRLVVLHSADAGSQSWPDDAIEARLAAAGHEALMVPLSEGWRAALERGADAFVAAGGDGTIRELARALAGTDARLGIIPLGTANNIARAFGYVPGSDPFAQVERWGTAERILRVVRAGCGPDDFSFLEVAGVGAFARLLRKEGMGRRRPLASLMAARRRLAHGVLEGPVLDADVSIDGESVEGRFVMIACLRLPSFGPALRLAPAQRPDDDEHTVVAVRNHQREQFAWWLATGEGDVREFHLGTGSAITLASDGPVHLDDDLIETPKHERRRVVIGRDGPTVRVLV